MTETSGSRRDLILLGGVLALVLVLGLVLFLLLRGSPQDGMTEPEGKDELAAEAEPGPALRPARERRPDHGPRHRRQPAATKVETAGPAQPVTPETRPLGPPARPYVLEKGRLIVRLGDRDREGELPIEQRPRYLLVMMPVTGVDARLHGRVVEVRAGQTLIEDLPCVSWDCRLVGDREQRGDIVTLRPGADGLFQRLVGYREGFAVPLLDCEIPENAVLADLRLVLHVQRPWPRLLDLVRYREDPEGLFIRIGRSTDELAAQARLFDAQELGSRTTAGLAGPDGLPLRYPGQGFKVRFEAATRPVAIQVRGPSGGPILDGTVVFSAGDSPNETLARLRQPESSSLRRPERIPRMARTNLDGKATMELPEAESGAFWVAVPGLWQRRPNYWNGEGEPEPIRLEKARRVVAMVAPDAETGAAPEAWFGPLDDPLCRIRPAEDGSILLESLPDERCGIGRFIDPCSESAGSVWTVEIDQPVDQPFRLD